MFVATQIQDVSRRARYSQNHTAFRHRFLQKNRVTRKYPPDAVVFAGGKQQVSPPSRFLIGRYGDFANQLFLQGALSVKRTEFQGLENLERLLKPDPLSGRKYHILIAPNHYGFADGFVVRKLSKQVKQPFYFMIATDMLQKCLGWMPSKAYKWVCAKAGILSVNRYGFAGAIKHARQALDEGQAPVTIFGEGLRTGLNDKVGTYDLGLPMIALGSAKSGYPVAIVPVGIKYRFSQSSEKVMQSLIIRLDRLEQSLGIPSRGPLMHADKLTSGRLIARTNDVLQELVLRKRLNKTGEVTGLAQLHQQMLREQLDAIAGEMGISLDKTLAPLSAIYELRKQIAAPEKLVIPKLGKANTRENSQFIQRQYIPKRLTELLQLQKLQFDYLTSSTFTPERFNDILSLAETGLYGKHSSSGKKRAIVAVGKPILLEPGTTQSKQDLAERIRLAIQATLDEIAKNEQTKPFSRTFKEKLV